MIRFESKLNIENKNQIRRMLIKNNFNHIFAQVRGRGDSFYNSNIVPQVSSSSEIVDMAAIFNDVVLAARGGSIHRAGTSGSWTSTITGLGTPTRNYEFRKFNFDENDIILEKCSFSIIFFLNK